MTDLNGKLYVLATAARNEEKHIKGLIESVVAQSLQPQRWVIVSDGSTDHTDDIVRGYAAKYEFVRLHRITEDHPRNFAAQANAINAGFSFLQNLEYDFIGNLDADISLSPSYFEDLLDKFHQNPRLGLGGGYLYEKSRGRYQLRKGSSPNSVAHGVQLFRRECLAAIGGGYVPLPYGGPDSHAEVMARMKGWHVQAFPDLRAYHHRPTGSADGQVRYSFRQGLCDYSFGIHPLFEILRILVRIPKKPYILGALVRYYAFLFAALRREKRPVSDEFVRYLRKEERGRLWPFGPRSREGSKASQARVGGL